MADEELSDSPLFALFLSSPHYPVAASSALIVALPPTASLADVSRVTLLSLLDSHLLRKSPYYQDQYVTANGKSVLLFHSSLQCKSGFAEPRTVQVVGIGCVLQMMTSAPSRCCTSTYHWRGGCHPTTSGRSWRVTERSAASSAAQWLSTSSS